MASSIDPRRRLDEREAADRAAARDRDDACAPARALSSLLRDLGVLLSRGDERWLANADMKPLLRRVCVHAFDGDRTVRAFAAVDRAVAALERNASPKIVADWLAFQV